MAWTDSRTGEGSGIWGVRVDPTGTVLDPNGIEIGGGGDAQSSPQVASNGTDFLVVWQDQAPPFASTLPVIYGTVVRGDATVVTPGGARICQFASEQETPAVTAVGAGYFVVWVDTRNAGAPKKWGTDLYGAHIDGNGVVADTNGIAVETNPSNQTLPSVAYAATPGRIHVIWKGRCIHARRVLGRGARYDRRRRRHSVRGQRSRYSASEASVATGRTCSSARTS